MEYAAWPLSWLCSFQPVCRCRRLIVTPTRCYNRRYTVALLSYVTVNRQRLTDCGKDGLCQSTVMNCWVWCRQQGMSAGPGSRHSIRQLLKFFNGTHHVWWTWQMLYALSLRRNSQPVVLLRCAISVDRDNDAVDDAADCPVYNALYTTMCLTSYLYGGIKWRHIFWVLHRVEELATCIAFCGFKTHRHWRKILLRKWSSTSTRLLPVQNQIQKHRQLYTISSQGFRYISAISTVWSHTRRVEHFQEVPIWFPQTCEALNGHKRCEWVSSCLMAHQWCD